MAHDVGVPPDGATHPRLLDEELDPKRREVLLAHANDRPAGCGISAEPDARWSLAPLVDTVRRGNVEMTAALKEHTAATPPDMTAAARRGSDTAAIPSRVPVIPGIVDLEPIDRGGMGVVYRGREISLDRIVAVKVLSVWAPPSESARQRAEREALMLAKLDHPNVVAIYAAGEAEGTPYIVMEWVAGPTLQKQIDAGRFAPREAARIGRDLARALERVHSLGIVHRDVKPDNVLVATEVGESSTPKLADFGLARPEHADALLTQADDVLGTPAYMAAEQTGLNASAGEVGSATDIHGLGGVIFAMLTGHPPYEAATAVESMQRAARGDVTHATALATVPADLRTIVWKCLSSLPARRYRSAGELADDLDRYLEGRPVAARPITLPERAAKWARRRPVAALTATLSVAFVITAIVGTAYHVIQLEQANDQISRSRDRAEEAMAVATRSMDRLTGTAIKQMLLRGKALDEEDRAFLQQVRDELREWPLGSQPVESLRFRVVALRRIAGMFFDVGHFADALACQESELAALDELETLVPGDVDVLQKRLDARYRQRWSLYQLRRPEEAAASARESIALLEAAPAHFPDRERALADTRLYLGAFLHDHHHVAEGSQEIAKAVDAVHSIHQRNPDDIGIAHQQVNALYVAQMYALRAGRLDERRAWLDRLVGEATSAIERFPVTTENRHARSGITKMLAISLSHVADLAADAGQLGEAFDLTSRRQQVSRAFLDGLSPNLIDDVHRELVDADIHAAILLQKLDRRDEAEASLDEAHNLATRLMDEQPAIWTHAILLARVLHQQADVAAAGGDVAKAISLLERETSVLEPWVSHKDAANDTADFLETARADLANLRSRAAVAAD